MLTDKQQSAYQPQSSDPLPPNKSVHTKSSRGKAIALPSWWKLPVAAVAGVVVGAGAMYLATDSAPETERAEAVSSAENDRTNQREGINAKIPGQEVDSEGQLLIDKLPKIGEAAVSGSEKVVVDSVTVTPTVEMRDNDNFPNTVMSLPKNQGAKFVVVTGTVFNEGSTPFNTVLLGGNAWIADASRMYDMIDDHGRVVANTEYLNNSIGPGFSTPFSWVFEVPDDFTPEIFRYDDCADHEIGDDITNVNVHGYDK